MDFDALHATQRLTVALDRVIDVNHYPLGQRGAATTATGRSLGVQGLADVFAELRTPVASARAT